MGDIIHNISRVDQAVCWPDFTAPYSTKPSAELSSCFRLTLSCCSTTSTVDEVQRYARYAIKLVIYTLVHVMLSYLLWIGLYYIDVELEVLRSVSDGDHDYVGLAQARPN